MSEFRKVYMEFELDNDLKIWVESYYDGADYFDEEYCWGYSLKWGYHSDICRVVSISLIEPENYIKDFDDIENIYTDIVDEWGLPIKEVKDWEEAESLLRKAAALGEVWENDLSFLLNNEKLREDMKKSIN